MALGEMARRDRTLDLTAHPAAGGHPDGANSADSAADTHAAGSQDGGGGENSPTPTPAPTPATVWQPRGRTVSLTVHLPQAATTRHGPHPTDAAPATPHHTQHPP